MDLKKTINNTQIHNIQYSIIDRKNGFLTSYDSLTIQKNAKIIENTSDLTVGYTLLLFVYSLALPQRNQYL